MAGPRTKEVAMLPNWAPIMAPMIMKNTAMKSTLPDMDWRRAP